MNIPKRCEECKFCLRQETNDYGSFGECLLRKDKKVNCLAWSIDDNCPLVEVVTCKDCKYWNKKEEYCKQLSNTMGWTEDECYTVCTGADFFLFRWRKKRIMRWVTFYYDLLNNRVYALKAHDNKEVALDYFNIHCRDYFQLNNQFKADKLPASYGYPMRKFYGISARAFKKMFNCNIDEALRLAEKNNK